MKSQYQFHFWLPDLAIIPLSSIPFSLSRAPVNIYSSSITSEAVLALSLKMKIRRKDETDSEEEV